MANYSLVVNSKFQPFSFERYIQPYQMYGEAYKEVENALGELATKASVWEEMANEQTDPYAYKMYKTYANDLEKQAGQLAREGLNAASRRDMLNTRARYSKEITPIENAYKKREEDIARQKKVADATGGRTVFTRDARTTSLDKYMEGIDDYGQTNLDELYKEGAAGGAAISKRYLSTREGQLFNGMYLNLQRTTGMTNDQIQQFLSNQKDAKGNLLFPELHALKNELLSKSNYQNYSVADQNRMEQAILSGINTGIVYNVEDKPMENWRAKMAAQEAMQKRAEARAAARGAAGQGQAPINGLALNPSNIYSNRELEASEKKYKSAMKNYSKYFYKDSHGRMRMTWAGWKEYNRNATPKATVAGSGSGTAALMNEETQMQNGSKKFTPTAFRQFMNSIGAYNVTKGKWQPGNLGNVWGRYANDSPMAKTAKYDAMKTSEYIYDVPANDEYQNNFKSKLSRAIGSSGELEEVDYNPKTNKWEATGKTLPFSKFDTKEYKLVSRVPSEIGTTWFIKKDKETAKRYRAIPGVHTTAEGGRDEAITQMLITQRMLQNPNLTPQQRAKLENYYDNLTQQEIMFESQLDLTNQTSTQNINPYYVP